MHPEVVFPKQDIFTIGYDSAGPLSKIGPESNKFIRNNKLYQVFSILVKSPISQVTWLELYKKFVHPAGFYIAGQVVTDVEAVGTFTAPLVIEDSANRKVISTAAITAQAPFTQLTALFDSSDGTIFRARLDEKVSEYQTLSATQLQGFYRNVDELITANSFTFDDSGQGKDFLGALGDSAEAAAPDFSLELETMDNEQFDSSFNS